MQKLNKHPRNMQGNEPLLGESLLDSANKKIKFKAISVTNASDLPLSSGVIDLSLDDDGDPWGAVEPLPQANPTAKIVRPTRFRGKKLMTVQRRERMRKRQAKLNRAKPKPTAKRAEPQTAESDNILHPSFEENSLLSASVARIKSAVRRTSKRHFGPIPAKQFGENKEHPDARVIDSLLRCETVEDVAHWHTNGGDNFTTKCAEAYKRRKLPPDMRLTIDALIEGSATTSPNLLNLKVLKLSWEHCYRLLWAFAEANPDIEFVLVTIIDGRGGTSSYAPFIELCEATRKAQVLARAISPNFLGVNELAMFKSQTHADGGRHMQTHQHILAFGEKVVSRAKAVAKKRMLTFEANITSAPQIDVRRVEASKVNLARVCAYLFKQPHKSMNWVPARDGKPGFMNQSKKGERFINYLRLAQIRSMMTIEDVLFAGGACKAIKSDLVKLLRQSCLSEVPIIGRRLHPDAVPSFWNEVNKAMGRPEFRLPVVGRNP